MSSNIFPNNQCDRFNRRDFIKQCAVGGMAAALAGQDSRESSAVEQGADSSESLLFTAKTIDPVRIGFVGVGGMGTQHVKNLLAIEGVELKAVCDIVSERVINAQDLAVSAGKPKPNGYTRGETDFKRMCEEEDLDLVYTATPWEWHVPVCIAAMETGKHAATEVPAAVTLDECWQLVETAEKRKKHCIMMENCCYGYSELMVLKMVRRGLLGELLYSEVGYLHDLRALKFSGKGEGLWRTVHSIRRNGNLYPTHGLGPSAQCMNINRGDRFEYLVSMSGNSRGLNLYAENAFGKDDPRTKQKYAIGDINVSMIRTTGGLSITVVHDCSSPRPYSRISLVQGTKGIFQGYPDRIYIEGRSQFDQWETLDGYQQEYEHPLWRKLKDMGPGGGHGAMDFIEDYRLIQCLREGLPMDMDVYDAAVWSAVSELSERSVADKSRPKDFPDFTHGAWKKRPPLGIIGE